MLTGLACGGGLPLVERTAHPPGAAFERVEAAPPPALIETLTARAPAPDCRWRDGFWRPGPADWTWQPGRWVRPPPGCRFAPPALRWKGGDQDELLYTAAEWYSEAQPGRPCRHQVKLCQ